MKSHDNAVEIQRRYYADTAAQYAEMHSHEGDADPQTMSMVCALLDMVQAQSALDVGAGTGRAIRHFLDHMPALSIRGIEPVEALIEQAIQKNGVPRELISQGVGQKLPFGDASIDVVFSFAILHHVPDPDSVIREMLRVARKAVIIVDGNRFGQGSFPVRLLKLCLYKLGLWGAVNYAKTGGKGYLITEGDGLAYSYSVYDSFDRLAKWAARLIVIPAESGTAQSWFHPLLTSGCVLVCALKGTD